MKLVTASLFLMSAFVISANAANEPVQVGRVQCQIGFQSQKSELNSKISFRVFSQKEISNFCTSSGNSSENLNDCIARLNNQNRTPYTLDAGIQAPYHLSAGTPQVFTKYSVAASVKDLKNFKVLVNQSNEARIQFLKIMDQSLDLHEALMKLSPPKSEIQAVNGRIQTTFQYAVVDKSATKNKYGIKIETATIQCQLK